MTTTAPPMTRLLASSKLPTFPAVGVRLMQMLAQDDADFPKICGLLQTDAALSTEVLRLANSPLFCPAADVKSIPLALATLGLDRLNLLVATTALWRAVPGSFSRQLVRTWWRHNLACALLCHQLSSGKSSTDYCYVAGLLHSVGQLALIGSYPSEYRQLQERALAEGRSLLDCEWEALGLDHCSLGEALLTRWGIPFEIADSAAHHHDPENAESPFTEAVHIACLTVNQWGFAVLANRCLPADELPTRVRDLAADEALCASITEKVGAIESHLL